MASKVVGLEKHETSVYDMGILMEAQWAGFLGVHPGAKPQQDSVAFKLRFGL